MKLKKVLCCLCVLMFVIGTLCTNASAANIPVPSGLKTIDNDPLSNTGYWVKASRFDRYIQALSLYNKDARTTEGKNIGTYSYLHDGITLGSSYYAMAGVYLNHNNFQDPNATYQLHITSKFLTIGTINQADAPGGWSYLSFPTTSNPIGDFGHGLRVVSSGRNIAGADAISIQYWSY